MIGHNGDALLQAGEYRLIVVSGPQGCGKSTLVRRSVQGRHRTLWLEPSDYAKPYFNPPAGPVPAVVVLDEPKGQHDQAVIRQVLSWCVQNATPAILVISNSRDWDRFKLSHLSVFADIRLWGTPGKDQTIGLVHKGELVPLYIEEANPRSRANADQC